MTREPVVMPALPTPAMARPTMKAVEVGAAAQMIEPTSKTRATEMKVHLAEKKVYELAWLGQVTGRSPDKDGRTLNSDRPTGNFRTSVLESWWCS